MDKCNHKKHVINLNKDKVERKGQNQTKNGEPSAYDQNWIYPPTYNNLKNFKTKYKKQ